MKNQKEVQGRIPIVYVKYARVLNVGVCGGLRGCMFSQQSSNSDQMYQHQFKEFEKEWQSLETLNLVLERYF